MATIQQLAVPHLTTALTGPLLELEAYFLRHQARIEAWLRAQWRHTPPPFYCSVDIRNSGYKVAPVDTNLFPAGFNNLNPAFLPLCIQAAQSAVERVCPSARQLLLVPESHTRNTYYLESLATLCEILAKAGFDVRIGSLLEISEPQTVTLPSGRVLRLEPIIRKNNAIGVAEFWPCMVLLNNDLSSGVPDILRGLEQPVMPPADLGWASRLKSSHFRHYHEIAREFAEIVEVDAWFIDPLFRQCGEIDFMKREGEECLRMNVAQLLADIQRKYDQYGIAQSPFVIVKADAGTYGMGVMTIRDSSEIGELNRKERTRMSSGKGGQSVSKVILQEGVYTFETWGEEHAIAEPVVYMMDRFVVGGFYRVHTKRGTDENLNAPGMHFEPLAFVRPCNTPEPTQHPDAEPNRFYCYGVIARLALVAATREIVQVEQS